MQIITEKMQGWWLEEYVPPRCRKPRWRVASGEVEASIESYSADEAPVAFVIRHPHEGRTAEIRFADGKYYRSVDARLRWGGGDDWISCLKAGVNGLSEAPFERYGTGRVEADGYPPMLPIAREDLEERIGWWLSGKAMIDGEAWEECGEPIWAVRWQGVTAIAYARIPEKGERPYGFNAFQKDMATIPERFKPVSFCDEIEVRIPEAVRRDPLREKLERDAKDAAKKEAVASRRLKEAREENRQAQSALAEYLDMTAGARWRCGS